jgi:prevent-host-death family protein
MSTLTISTLDLRGRIGDVINRVIYRGERVILEKRGKPVAAIIGMDELRRLEQLEDARDAEIIRMAKATGEGVVPFSAVVEQYERLHGEHLELTESGV